MEDDDLHIYNELEFINGLLVEGVKSIIRTKTRYTKNPEEYIQFILELEDESDEIKYLKELIIFNMGDILGRK